MPVVSFQYIKQGYAGYQHSHTHAIRGGINYNDALKALHAILTVSRTFSTSPYTPTRQFVGDYIILSAIEQESKSDSWQATSKRNYDRLQQSDAQRPRRSRLLFLEGYASALWHHVQPKQNEDPVYGLFT